ncbi:hypothetical protein Hanom_Chr16g01522381 [Helianthus anomalus]
MFQQRSNYFVVVFDCINFRFDLLGLELITVGLLFEIGFGSWGNIDKDRFFFVVRYGDSVTLIYCVIGPPLFTALFEFVIICSIKGV